MAHDGGGEGNIHVLHDSVRKSMCLVTLALFDAHLGMCVCLLCVLTAYSSGDAVIEKVFPDKEKRVKRDRFGIPSDA